MTDSGDVHRRRRRRRIALAAGGLVRLALLPALSLIALGRRLIALLAGMAGLIALIIEGNHHRDDEADAPVRTWRELALAPLWFPVAAAMIMRQLWGRTFGGLAGAIGGEIVLALRMLARSARGR